MSGGELAALIAAVAFVALVAVTAVMLARLHATLSSVQSLVDDLHQNTVPLLQELHQTVSTLNVELDRIDGILGSAESVASSASSVAGLVQTAVSNPLVKGVALLTGVGAGVRSFRKARRKE